MAGDDTLLGSTFGGRFRATAFLAEGGMGTIFRGVDEQGGAVAIKVMKEDLAKDESFVRRFQREAKTSSKLRHRSTVRIHDFGVESGRPYLVMDLLAGAELQSVLDHEKRFSEARAVRIMAQVASALAAAHDLGIVHRDLKPENIMICRDQADPTRDQVKVLDFGIAKMMAPELCSSEALPVSSDAPSSSRAELTRMGTLLGTPDFMAPEQLRGEAVDARTDLYACGVILFYLLTGRIPLAGESYVATIRLRNDHAPAPPSALVPATSPKLDALILATLARDPTERPRSARHLQEALLELLPDLATTPHPLGSTRGAAITTKERSTEGGPTLPSKHTTQEGATRTPLPNLGVLLDSMPPPSNRAKVHERSEWIPAPARLPSVDEGAEPTLLMGATAPRSPPGARGSPKAWHLAAVGLVALALGWLISTLVR